MPIRLICLFLHKDGQPWKNNADLILNPFWNGEKAGLKWSIGIEMWDIYRLKSCINYSVRLF